MLREHVSSLGPGRTAQGSYISPEWPHAHLPSISGQQACSLGRDWQDLEFKATDDLQMGVLVRQEQQSACITRASVNAQRHTGAGSTARDDHVSYLAAEYRDGLQFIYNKVCFEDKDLQTDDQRVELYITPV